MNSEKYYQQAFNAVSKNTSDYEKFESIKLVIQSAVNDTKGKENERFYRTLNKLMNAINNVGWEEKKSYLMTIISDEQECISEQYEDYLP